MAREAALELCRDILAQPRCEVLISGANTSYLCPKQGDIVTLVRDFVGNHVALLSAPEEMPEAIVKVSAYCRDAAAELKARFPRHCAQVVPELARLADALPPRI